MADLKLSTKRVQIDKANASIVLVLGITSFIVVSSLIFCKALLAQRSYQSKVIKAQNVAKDQLKQNIDNLSALKAQYQAFADQAQNVIGGSSTGTGDHDGDNARIILDALPSKYDFPALATSLDKLLTNSGVKVTAINGTDDEIAQSNNSSTDPVDIPFTLSVTGSYAGVKNFIGLLEHSIRPIKVKNVVFAGSENDLTVTVSASTSYRPAKILNIQEQEVRPWSKKMLP